MFTVKQTADRLGISSSLVYGLLKARKIRHVRHGLGRGTIRIPADAVDEYQRGQMVGVRAGDPAPRPKVKLHHLHL